MSFTVPTARLFLPTHTTAAHFPATCSISCSVLLLTALLSNLNIYSPFRLQTTDIMVTQPSTCLWLSDNTAGAITWWRRLPEKFCRNPIGAGLVPAVQCTALNIVFLYVNGQWYTAAVLNQELVGVAWRSACKFAGGLVYIFGRRTDRTVQLLTVIHSRRRSHILWNKRFTASYKYS